MKVLVVEFRSIDYVQGNFAWTAKNLAAVLDRVPTVSMPYSLYVFRVLIMTANPIITKYVPEFGTLEMELTKF